MRGVAGNWLYIVLVGQVVVTVWFAPRLLAVLLGLVPEAAYWASAAVTPPGPAQGNAPVVSSVLLLVVLIIHWAGRSMLYRRAAQADRGFAAADSEAHDQYVVLSRNIERREHERLLHDTVLNTLTAISRGSSGAMVVARCRHDIALLEHALADPAGAAEPPAPAGATLVADVETVAAEMRARGLRITLEVSGRGEPGIPAPVAGAIVHATREALANVAAHAGTGEAWVTITPGTGPAGRGCPGPRAVGLGRRDHRAGRGGGLRPGPGGSRPAGAAPLDHRTGRGLGWPRVGAVGAGSGHGGGHELGRGPPGRRG